MARADHSVPNCEDILETDAGPGQATIGRADRDGLDLAEEVAFADSVAFVARNGASEGRGSLPERGAPAAGRHGSKFETGTGGMPRTLRAIQAREEKAPDREQPSTRM